MSNIADVSAKLLAFWGNLTSGNVLTAQGVDRPPTFAAGGLPGLQLVLTNSQTVNPPSLLDGEGASILVTLTGALLGDMVIFGMGLGPLNTTITVTIAAADTGFIRVQNESGGAVDMGASTWTFAVFRLSP